VQEAAQLSRNEVFDTFLGVRTSADSNGALLLIPDITQLDRYAPNNTCPLFVADLENYGAVYVRDNSEIRPSAWRVLHGFPGDPNQNYCNYTLFDSTLCPHAVLSKAENMLTDYLNAAYSHKLTYSIEDQAWITLRPDPSGFSRLPQIVFGLFALLLGAVFSVGFVLFEAGYLGLCDKHCKPQANPSPEWFCPPLEFLCCGIVKKVDEDPIKAKQADEARKTAHKKHLRWIFVTAFIPAAFVCLIGLFVYCVVIILIPDLKGILTNDVWVTFFLVGLVAAVVVRFYCYNLFHYFRACFCTEIGYCCTRKGSQLVV